MMGTASGPFDRTSTLAILTDLCFYVLGFSYNSKTEINLHRFTVKFLVYHKLSETEGGTIIIILLH